MHALGQAVVPSFEKEEVIGKKKKKKTAKANILCPFYIKQRSF